MLTSSLSLVPRPGVDEEQNTPGDALQFLKLRDNPVGIVVLSPQLLKNVSSTMGFMLIGAKIGFSKFQKLNLASIACILVKAASACKITKGFS